MFVCICNAITDRQIQETVAAGASTLGDLQAQLGGHLLRLLQRFGFLIFKQHQPKSNHRRHQRAKLMLPG